MKAAKELNKNIDELLYIIEQAIDWASNAGHHNVSINVSDYSDDDIKSAVITLREYGYKVSSWEQLSDGILRKYIDIRW